MGIGVFSTTIDNADFPDLSNYDGDWMAYECNVFQMPGVDLAPVVPESASTLRADYRSMRKVPRVGMTPFFVAQSDSTIDFDIDFVISQLILLP